MLEYIQLKNLEVVKTFYILPHLETVLHGLSGSRYGTVPGDPGSPSNASMVLYPETLPCRMLQFYQHRPNTVARNS